MLVQKGFYSNTSMFRKCLTLKIFLSIELLASFLAIVSACCLKCCVVPTREAPLGNILPTLVLLGGVSMESELTMEEISKGKILNIWVQPPTL